MKRSSCLIKTLLGRLTTLAETQERDLAYVQAERVCQPEQRMYSPQNREETSQEKSGRIALHFEKDPLGVVLFPEVVCFPPAM